MSESETASLTNRQIAFAGAKFAILISIAILLAFGGMTWLLGAADSIKSFAINALILAVALNFGANGVLALLQILDWFRERRHAPNG